MYDISELLKNFLNKIETANTTVKPPKLPRYAKAPPTEQVIASPTKAKMVNGMALFAFEQKQCQV